MMLVIAATGASGACGGGGKAAPTAPADPGETPDAGATAVEAPPPEPPRDPLCLALDEVLAATADEFAAMRGDIIDTKLRKVRKDYTSTFALPGTTCIIYDMVKTGPTTMSCAYDDGGDYAALIATVPACLPEGWTQTKNEKRESSWKANADDKDSHTIVLTEKDKQIRMLIW